MEDIRRRLKDLERRGAGEERQPRSPEHVYDRIRREARESIEESLREGEEPLYRIAENGDVLAADDGETVNHYGDFIRALDRRIDRLSAEIVELEEENSQEGSNA